MEKKWEQTSSAKQNEIRKIDEIYLKEYIRFSLNLPRYTASTWYEKYHTAASLQEKEFAFIQSTISLMGAVENYISTLLVLKYARSNKIPMIFTLNIYKPGDTTIETLIQGKTDRDIELMFGLNQIYKKHGPDLKTKEIRKMVKDFLPHLKSIAKLQKERRVVYNKIKHSNMIVEFDDALSKKRSLAVLDKNFKFSLISFSDNEIKKIYEMTQFLCDATNENIILYATKYLGKSKEEIQKIYNEPESNN